MRLIDADALANYANNQIVGITANEIMRFPTVDAEPVKHALWVQVDETKCRCTNCDVIALIGLYPHGDKRYCPNCGAKMDGGEKND